MRCKAETNKERNACILSVLVEVVKEKDGKRTK